MSVKKAYAKALYLAASAESESANQLPTKLDTIEADLRSVLVSVNSSRELKTALFSPATSKKEKGLILAEISKVLSLSKMTEKFLVLLANKSRLMFLGDIVPAFQEVRMEQIGGVLGEVRSATEISQSEQVSLIQAFEKKLNCKVAFRFTVDPDLLAGLKVKVKGQTYDGTLRTQLERLTKQLLNA